MGLPAVPPLASFSGSSQFSQNLQSVISRAVAFASLPLGSLQAAQNTANGKLGASQSLQNVLNIASAAVQGLSSAAVNTLSTAVSNQAVLQATTSATARPGTYTVQITDPGSSTNALSNDGLPAVTDPATQSISNSSSLTLTAGSGTFQIKPTAHTLQALADAINSSGAPLQATIINIGGATPDYRLALQATTIGAVAVQLSDGADLIKTLVTGANATYTVNGQPAIPISSASSTVTIAPGLTAHLETAGSATITVANSGNSVSNALSGFVNAFNTVVSELNKSHGQNGGPLSGNSIISSVTTAFQQIVNYSNSGSGAVQSLTDLGVEFTKDGTLTFDASKVNGLNPSQLQDALKFLGGASTGGFLQKATNVINGLVDPTNGLVTSDIAGLTQDVSNDAKKISDQQDRITQLQNNLTSQMAAADALIASLEQQTSFLTQLFNTTNANNNIGH